MRRLMTLANIPVLKESTLPFQQEGWQGEEGMEDEEGAEAPVPGAEGGESDELDLDLGDEMGGGEAAPAGDMQAAFKKAVEALAQAFGVQASVEGGEGEEDHSEPDADQMGGPSDMDADNAGDEEGEEDGEEDMDEGMGSEQGEQELEESEDLEEGEELDESEELDEKEEKEMDESRMSTDELVETVLRRVTARLLSEKKDAEKKGGKKQSAKDKMAAMRAKKKGAPAAKKGEDKKKKPMKEANASAPKTGQSNGAKNGLKAAGKPVDVWKGTPDMEWRDGEKNTKGGHAMKPMQAKGPHAVTHKKTSAVTTKGKNKTK